MILPVASGLWTTTDCGWVFFQTQWFNLSTIDLIFSCDGLWRAQVNTLVGTSYYVAVIKTTQVCPPIVLWSVMYSKRSEAHKPPATWLPAAFTLCATVLQKCPGGLDGCRQTGCDITNYWMCVQRICIVSVMPLTNIQQNKFQGEF